MAGGKASRDKGCRVEREVVARLRLLGLEAERVPLSGAAGGSYTGDVIVRIPGVGELEIEVKARKDGMKTYKKMIGNSDFLVTRDDREDPYVFMPWSTFAKLAS